MGEQEDDADNNTELSTITQIFRNFTPIWILICTDTGTLSILVHQLPCQFRSLKIISPVIHIFSLILFIYLFLIIFFVRMFRHP